MFLLVLLVILIFFVAVMLIYLFSFVLLIIGTKNVSENYVKGHKIHFLNKQSSFKVESVNFEKVFENLTNETTFSATRAELSPI